MPNWPTAMRPAWPMAASQWRNRVGAEHVRVDVARLKDGKAEQQWRFDALAQNLRALDALSDEVKSLGSVIAEGLAGGHVLLQVTAFLRVGAGKRCFRPRN